MRLVVTHSLDRRKEEGERIIQDDRAPAHPQVTVGQPRLYTWASGTQSVVKHNSLNEKSFRECSVPNSLKVLVPSSSRV